MAYAREHSHDILAVVLVRDVALRILQALGFHLQILAFRQLVGAINIEFEVRHNEEVIPQLVGKVGRIAQKRIEVAHNGNHRPGLAVTLIAVLNLEERIDHLLNMTTILGNHQTTA